MGRACYTDDGGGWELAQWRSAVASAICGRRGQRFLRELRDALDAMPEKALVASDEGEIVNADGDCCTLGSVALARGWSDARDVDSTEHERLAERLDIAPALVREIEYLNDEACSHAELPTSRWRRMRAWVENAIKAKTKGPSLMRDDTPSPADVALYEQHHRAYVERQYMAIEFVAPCNCPVCQHVREHRADPPTYPEPWCGPPPTE